MPKAQEWLNEYLNNNYPHRTRSQTEKITSINMINQQLEGKLELNLDDFPNLVELDCSNNRITEINFVSGVKSSSSKRQKMEWKLKKLNLSNNNFAGQDLSFLTELTELEELLIGNNKLIGSLKPLKNMTKLRKLDISNTDIDSGLEYLPNSLEEICCSAEKEDAKVKIIAETIDSLFKAVKENKIGEVREIVEAEKLKNINFHDKHGNSLLHYSTQKDNLDLLKLLVGSGVDVKATDKRGWSVLHSAALWIVSDQGDWNIIEFLLESGADPDAETDNNLTTRDIFFQKDYSYIEQYDILVEKIFQQTKILVKDK